MRRLRREFSQRSHNSGEGGSSHHTDSSDDVSPFWRSGCGERLEQAIRAEQRALDEVSGHRRDYTTKVIR